MSIKQRLHCTHYYYTIHYPLIMYNCTLSPHTQGTDDNTWSLGYMLEETQNIGSTAPQEKKKRPYSTTSLILSLVELVILLVLFSLFLISVVHVSCSDKHRNGYIAIS